MWNLEGQVGIECAARWEKHFRQHKQYEQSDARKKGNCECLGELKLVIWMWWTLSEEMTSWKDIWGRISQIIGEDNGTPLQYSCLENPMGRGAWWAAVHGVAKSRTRLSDFTFTFHFHALEKEMAAHSSVLAWRILGTAEPGRLPSMGSHRVRHDWSDLVAAAAVIPLQYLFTFQPC